MERYLTKSGLPLDYRGTDAVSSKWSDLRKKITRFNGIFNRIYNHKPSGWDMMMVMNKAKEEYRLSEKHDFNLEKVWDVVRDDPKWKDVKPVEVNMRPRSSTSSKRSRGEGSVDISDGRINVDLNSAGDEIEVEEDVGDEDDLAMRPSMPRPRLGRDKAKRAAKFGEEKEKKEKDRQEIKDKLAEHLQTTKERKELQSRYLELETERASDAQLLTHLSILEKKEDNYDPSDRPMVASAKGKSRSWVSKFLGC